MDIMEELDVIKRGAVEIITEKELIEKLEKSRKSGRPLRVKAGFDPTAPDIHLGHTVLIQKMKQFQDLGHEVYFLIGDFTGMIGDPSGRSETRPPMTRDEVLANAKTYKEQIFKILDPEKTKVVFNSEWMNSMTASQLIELAGKYTVARMLERDDFHKRFVSHYPIGIHEFLYPLIQGYDSVALKADVELGGTDQKFNLIVGRELQREFGQEPQVVIMMPLLEGIDGVNKMSKSLGNYIGINEPPKDIYGKIMSISDELMWKYYELLSAIPMEEIRRMKERAERGLANPKDFKKRLAFEIVERFHGYEASCNAQRIFEEQFEKRGIPSDLESLNYFTDAEKVGIIDLLVCSNMVSSRSEARRLIRQGSVDLNGVRIGDELLQVPAEGSVIVKVGKRKIKRIIFQKGKN